MNEPQAITQIYKNLKRDLDRIERENSPTLDPVATAQNKWLRRRLLKAEATINIMSRIIDYMLPNQIRIMTMLNGNTKFLVGKFVMHPVPEDIQMYLEGDGR